MLKDFFLTSINDIFTKNNNNPSSMFEAQAWTMSKKTPHLSFW